jgi:hypothetical protein
MAIDLVSLRENMGLSVPLLAAVSWRLDLTTRERAENRMRGSKEIRVNAAISYSGRGGVAERLGAAPPVRRAVVGHAWRQCPFDARAAEHGGQGADTVVGLMDADGKHCALVPEDRLSEPCRDLADPVLAGADASMIVIFALLTSSSLSAWTSSTGRSPSAKRPRNSARGLPLVVTPLSGGKQQTD